MPQLNANPNAEVNLAFDVVKPGTYRMRVKEITEFTASSGNTCWRVRLEFTDPSSLSKEDGTPVKNAGTLLDSSLVVSPAEKQGKLRGFVEACGLPWANLDSDDLIGREVDCNIKIEEYQGEKKNSVGRYLKAQ